MWCFSDFLHLGKTSDCTDQSNNPEHTEHVDATCDGTNTLRVGRPAKDVLPEQG